LANPYIIAFCDRFVEIRDFNTGDLVQTMIINELQHLSVNSDKDPTAPIVCQKSVLFFFFFFFFFFSTSFLFLILFELYRLTFIVPHLLGTPQLSF